MKRLALLLVFVFAVLGVPIIEFPRGGRGRDEDMPLLLFGVPAAAGLGAGNLLVFAKGKGAGATLFVGPDEGMLLLLLLLFSADRRSQEGRVWVASESWHFVDRLILRDMCNELEPQRKCLAIVVSIMLSRVNLA